MGRRPYSIEPSRITGSVGTFGSTSGAAWRTCAGEMILASAHTKTKPPRNANTAENAFKNQGGRRHLRYIRNLRLRASASSLVQSCRHPRYRWRLPCSRTKRFLLAEKARRPRGGASAPEYTLEIPLPGKLHYPSWRSPISSLIRRTRAIPAGLFGGAQRRIGPHQEPLGGRHLGTLRCQVKSGRWPLPPARPPRPGPPGCRGRDPPRSGPRLRPESITRGRIHRRPAGR